MSKNTLLSASGSVSWATAANWSNLAVPVNSDEITIGVSTATLDTGYNQSAVTLTKLEVPLTFTGTAGLARQTPITISSILRASNTATLTTGSAHGLSTGDAVLITGVTETDYNGLYTVTVTGATTYTYTVANTPTTPATITGAYQQKYDYIAIGATTFRAGDPGNGATAGTGSGRLKFDFRGIQTAATIVGTKSSGTDSNLEPVRLLGTHASNVLNVFGGLVGVATTHPSEVSTILTGNVTGGQLNYGVGVTWRDLYQTGGTFKAAGTQSTASSIFAQSGGVATLGGAGTIVDLKIAGTTYFNLRKATAGDTVTGTLWLNDGAILDLTGNPSVLAVATLRCSGEVIIRRNKANPGQLTWTTKTEEPGCVIHLE